MVTDQRPVSLHCKNVRVIITLVWSSQLHLFRGFYYTRMIAVYKLDIEILIATFCFQNWWSRTAKALQSWETPNRCNSDNHSNFKMTLTFLQCITANWTVHPHLISHQTTFRHFSIKRSAIGGINLGWSVSLPSDRIQHA